MNRWTPAERDGTRQTIRFPSMKFLRTKANTLFFQPEPSDFNFELASQRGVPARLSSVPVIDQTPIPPIDYYIVLRIYTTLSRLHLTGMRRICNHPPVLIRNNRKHAHFLIYRNGIRIWRTKRKEGKNKWVFSLLYTEKCINFESYIYFSRFMFLSFQIIGIIFQF